MGKFGKKSNVRSGGNHALKRKAVVIVGGVAGGASCAARLRRMDESAAIIVFERGPYASFANCGIPYRIGGVIPRDEDLLVANEAVFRERLAITLRLRHDVIAIDREAREVEVRDLDTGHCSRQRYDALVLSPGASPIRPPLPGIHLPGIFTVRNIPDAREIREWIEDRKAGRAVVVGGGFIGLEMAENLRHRGLEVTVVEMLPQVMPPLDSEMATYAEECLEKNGVRLALGDAVEAFAAEGDSLAVLTRGGKRYPADVVIFAIGVRPEVGLAKAAGLEIGERGGIRVDTQMRTSDPAIWAVGDAVEVWDRGMEDWTLLALAGPANRQGRVAADAICGREVEFRGVQGTAICGFFGFQIGSTGLSEKSLKRSGASDFEKVYLHTLDHAGYYPGAEPLHLKLLFRKSDGRILGAQAAGGRGVDKRIDVIAMAIQMGASVDDLAEAELAYAPQFGAAKDPVNLLGMIARNHLSGIDPLIHWDDLESSYLLDVREPDECEDGMVAGAHNVPLGHLRDELGRLPSHGGIAVYCAAGGRAHTAVRILREHQFDARNVSGGYLSYQSQRSRSNGSSSGGE